MNGIEGRKLDRRQVEPGGLRPLDEDLGGLLVQAANEMPRHVE
jgi:hypothetical protein